MPKRTPQSLYFADDKDIYDLLGLSKRQGSVEKLVALARKRGLILSAADSRDELLTQIVRLPFDWPQLRELLEATDTADRRDRLTATSITSGLDVEKLLHAAETLRDERGDTRDEAFDIRRLDANTVSVGVKYSEVDHGKTRLVQKVTKEFTIEFERTKEGFVARHQDQERAAEILDGILGSVDAKEQSGTVRQKIELSGVRDPALRTKFFLDLTTGLPGFDREDVKSIKGSRLSKEIQPVEVNSPADEDGSDEGAERLPEEVAFEAIVKQIALKGARVIDTKQYDHLVEHGFFVSSIVWTATEKVADGVRAEFAAAFGSPEDATQFSYSVNGVWERGDEGNFKKGKVAAGKLDKTRLLRLLESTALEAMKSTAKAAESGLSPSSGAED